MNKAKMKCVYSASELALVKNLKNVLELNGIVSIIKNQYLSVGAGGLPSLETWPQLLVAEQDFENASRIIGADEAHSSWVCPKCNEIVEGQFSECWNCGTPANGC